MAHRVGDLCVVAWVCGSGRIFSLNNACAQDFVPNESVSCSLPLEDPDRWTRIAVIEALAEIRDPRCRALIEARQQDPDEGVRGTAAYWLSMLAHP